MDHCPKMDGVGPLRKMRVYLGGCKGDWRIRFKQALPEFECYDPFKHSNQQAISTFVWQDLEAIKASDMVIFYIDYPRFTGACVEAGYAFALNKPIILVYTLRGRVDEMLLGVSKKVFTDLDSAIERFKKGI